MKNLESYEILKQQFLGLESFVKVMEFYFTNFCIIDLYLIRSLICV